VSATGPHHATHQAIDAVWRIESPRLIAGLTRLVRDIARAEDLAQDALVAALEQWPATGIPDNPGAWLMATAKHRAIDHLRRSDVDWPQLVAKFPEAAAIPTNVASSVLSQIKYEGYITRQDKEIARMSTLETKLIPPTLDYASVGGLRNEAKQKLTRFTPRSLGQALRISGITPADVTVLAIHLERR